jgi:hypothetical protein
MDQDKVLREFAALPSEAQRQVRDFIAFLRTRYKRTRASKKSKQRKLADEAFIGIWRDRLDMQDSSSWVRSVRESEWVRSHD